MQLFRIRADNPRYARPIKAFAGLTHVPMLLKASFNENEPEVCRPVDALDCFLCTRPARAGRHVGIEGRGVTRTWSSIRRPGRPGLAGTQVIRIENEMGGARNCRSKSFRR